MRRSAYVVDALENPSSDKQSANRPQHGEEHQRNRQRAHHHLADAGPVAEIMPDQQAEAAWQNVDSHERLPPAIAAPAAAVDDRQKARVQQHLGGDLLDIASERFTDRVGEQVEGRARLAFARLDHGLEPSYPGIVEGVDEALRFRVDRSRDLFVHHRNDLPGDDGQDDAGADRAEKKDRQRESKSGGSEELTERRHESCNRRRGPC